MRQVTFRVEHDCPLAALSRAVPQARFTSWNGHRIEVLDVRCTRPVWDHLVQVASQHLEVRRTFATPEGGLIVAELDVPAGKSLSRILEANQCMALQPMQVANGWESYDAIAFGSAKDPEQGALAALSRQWPTQVTRRRDIAPSDLAASLFQSLRPVLESPTDKQAEALAAAARAGYYQSPRGATTAEVAATMGLGRSAFEERLRGAENRVLAAVAGALEANRLPP